MGNGSKITHFERWESRVHAAQEGIASAKAKITQLARSHEFARWRVAEKCGWANSLQGESKGAEVASDYPDDLEAADAKVESAIDQFVVLHEQMKTEKRNLRKHSEQLRKLLSKPVASPGSPLRT